MGSWSKLDKWHCARLNSTGFGNWPHDQYAGEGPREQQQAVSPSDKSTTTDKRPDVPLDKNGVRPQNGPGVLESNPTEFTYLAVGPAILTKLRVTYTTTLELKQDRHVVLNELQLNEGHNPKWRTLKMLCLVQVRLQKSELRDLLCLRGKKDDRNLHRRSGSVIFQRLLRLFLCLTWSEQRPNHPAMKPVYKY